ncbi:MAG: YwqG family protein [Ktedonobacteraceae bacterium]
MNRTEIEAAFTSAGLAQRIPEINLLTSNAVRLLTKPVNEATLQIGVSKIGGHPDLPVGIAWPTLKGQPQSFLAQIRLTEVQGLATRGLLPQLGMLWFFYDARQETFGENPQDRGGWSILFKAEQPATLKRQATPAKLPAASLFQSCILTLKRELTLALQPELELPDCNWSDKEQQAYEQVLEILRKPAELALPHHRMLGYPDTIQDDMRMQCQLTSNGITDSDDPRVAALQAGASDWLLLLQIDSDAGAHMRWSNNGMLYYWIKQADLQACCFEQSWLVLQSE